MINQELKYEGLSYKDDIIHIPVLDSFLKVLHLAFPSLFVPFVTKLLVILLVCSLVVLALAKMASKTLATSGLETSLDDVGKISEESQEQIIFNAIDQGIFTAEDFKKVEDVATGPEETDKLLKK